MSHLFYGHLNTVSIFYPKNLFEKLLFINNWVIGWKFNAFYSSISTNKSVYNNTAYIILL